MRPDLDDFEELNEADAPRSRAMSWLVLIVAVGGFAALAYYAYHSGSQSMQGGQVLVVQADPSPMKAAPTDPQGETFPNQDKTIYDAITPNAGDTGKVEKLLPEPEEPVIPEPAVEETAPVAAAPKADTTTYVNKELDSNNTPAIDPVDAQSMKQPAPAIAPESKPETAPVVAKAEPSAGAPEMVNTKTVTPAAAPKVVEAKPEPKPVATPAPAPKPAPVPAATGAYKIQLGAFKSDAEARQQWSKISAKHGDIIKGSPIIVKADVKGVTYYRLRASGYASADAAKAACAKLSSRGQACFPAGK